MLDTVRAWVPVACQAFMDYRLGAATLSAPMLAVVRRMLAGEAVEQAGSGLSKREWGELMGVLGRSLVPAEVAVAGITCRGGRYHDAIRTARAVLG